MNDSDDQSSSDKRPKYSFLGPDPALTPEELRENAEWQQARLRRQREGKVKVFQTNAAQVSAMRHPPIIPQRPFELDYPNGVFIKDDSKD